MSVLHDWLSAGYLAWIIRELHAMALGQTLFVVSWMTLPWWRTLIGRALMIKSFWWAVYLDWSVVIYHAGYFEYRYAIGFWLLLGVTLGIWSQTFALWYEIYHGWRDRRQDSDAPEVDRLAQQP